VEKHPLTVDGRTPITEKVKKVQNDPKKTTQQDLDDFQNLLTKLAGEKFLKNYAQGTVGKLGSKPEVASALQMTKPLSQKNAAEDL